MKRFLGSYARLLVPPAHLPSIMQKIALILLPAISLCVFTAAHAQTTSTSTNTIQVGGTISPGTTAVITDPVTSVTGAITDNGLLLFTQSGSLSNAFAISGSGSVTMAGTGTTTFSGNNTYTGITTVDAGTLILNSASFGSGARDYAISSNSVLVLNAASSITAASGSSAIGGAGTLRVTNGLLSTTNNSILTLAMGTGGLINVAAGATVRNGTYKNINWTNNQASMMLDGAVDMWDGQDIFIDALNGSGAVINSDPYTGNINFTLGVANGSGTFTGQLTAPYLSVIKSGTGTQILTGTNTYTNSTTISGGTLVISGLLGNGSYAAGITNNASLVFSNSGSQTLSGAISGSGSFTMAGTGTTTFSGNNTYTGITTVDAGTLILNSASFGSGARNYVVSSNSVLVLNATSSITAASGSSAIGGAGTLRVTNGLLSTNNNSILTLAMGPGGLINVAAGATLRNGAHRNVIWTNNQASMMLDGAVDMWDGQDIFIDALNGSGAVINSDPYTGNINFTLGVANGSGTFTGQLTAPYLSVIKSGTGTQILTGTNTYTNSTTISGGTLVISGLLGNGSYAAGITNNASLVFSNSGSQTLSGAISGSGSFTMAGAGRTTLSQANSYSGGTVVSQGALVGGASTSFGSGSIVLGDGNTGTSSVVLVANNSGGTSIANAITVANLGTGLVSIGGTNTGASSANVWNGPLTLNRNVQVFGDTNPGSSGRTSFLGQITGSGGITVTQGRVTLQNGTNNFTGPVVVNSGATLQLDVDTGLNEVIPNSAAVTVNGLLNFASRGGTETIGSLAGSGTVSSVVSGNYSLVVGGSTSTTFSGVITNGSGVIGLTKSGNGTLLLTGANGFTGGAALNGGTLAAGSANALGSSGAISFGGGTLQYSASNTTDYSGRFSNAAGQQYSIDTNGQNVTLGSNLTSSGGSFTKLGAGGVTLSGNSTYGAGTLVSQGALIGSNSTSFSSGAIVLGDGNTGTNGIVLMANTVDNTTITNAITVANLGTGLVSIGGTNTGSSSANAWTGTLTLNRNVQVFGDTTPGSSGRTSFLGQITGSGGITVTQGRVTLQNITNNFTGPVVVNSGATLQLDIGGGRNEVIPNSAAVTVNGLLNFASGGGTETIGSLAGSGTVSSFVAGTYSLVVGGSTSTTFSGVINNGSGVIGLTKSGNGTLTLSGPNSYTGGTIVSAGQLVGTTASLQGAITNNASVAFDQATTGNYSSLMSGSGSLTKLGVGKVMITGSNSYSGGTTITGGTVEVSAGGSAGGSAAGLGTGTVSIASGGQVTYYLSTASSHAIANAFSLSGGTLYSEDGFNNFAGLVTLASGASTISSRYEDTITLSGGLAGSGDVLLTQAGGLGDGPTYVLPSAGSNTGTVRVSGSSNGRITKLQVANVNALQSATLDMAAGDLGTVEFTVAGTNTYSLGGLQGARSLAFGGNSLSVGGNNQSTTYSGTLSGSGLLTKVGNAMLTLSGSNSYTGGTTISSGTLALSGVGSIGTGGLNLGTIGSPGVFDLLGLTAGSYSLPSSASLAGVGTLSGSGKSLAVLGSLAPGNSAGTITVGTGFTLDLSNSGSSVFEITSPAYTAGTYDLVSGDGSVVFGGILNLAFSGGSYADGTNVLQLFANTGGRSGNFSAVNATGLAAGQSATFNPTTGFITVVPEPSTYAMALAGLACGGYSIFRHRKRA